jgi:putative transposase
MPRCARIKSEDSVYHIMIRSISEVPLFKENADKELYLYLIRKYQEQYNFKVYAYCLMDNHGHLIIDANGADISKIMHGINFTYAQTFNIRHKRRGTLFQDRFKSKIVKDERYIITLSAYIHNNAKDIIGFKKNPAKYEFSSLSVYLGLRKDPYRIIDQDFILQFFGRNKYEAMINYSRLMSLCNEKAILDHIEFKDEKTEYKSERKILVRNFNVNDIIKYISEITNTNCEKMHIKNSRNTLEAKALSILLMRNLCNYKCSEICRVFGNITQARVSILCNLGAKIIDENVKFNNIISSFIKQFPA